MQTIKLNLIPGGVLPVVNVSQYDVGRQFAIQVYEGAASYNLTGKSVQIRGTKPDGNGFAYDSADGAISVSGNTVTVTTLQQMTACGGDTTVELRITASGVVLGTLNFILAVEASALSDDTPISDTDIPAIERDFQAALDEAEADALKAEGHAQGTQDGAAVDSSSPYYHNNAKYYKEQADIDATNAGNSATTATNKAGEAATSATNAGNSATNAAADALVAEGYANGTQNGTPVSSGSPYYQANGKYFEQQAGYHEFYSADYAKKSEGFAVGKQNGTAVSSDSPYYHNNAEYYRDQAAQYAAGGLHFMASVAFASIPTTGMVNGDMYNITDSFTTDSRFVEGAGIAVSAGTNIAWVDSVSKWDILAPGGGSGSLSGLSDVTITSASSGQALVYDGSKWVNSTVSTVGDLDDLSDVDITSASNGDLLQYNSTSQEWENSADIPNALAAVRDNGAVNRIKPTISTQTVEGVTCTLNDDGTVTASNGPATANFNMIYSSETLGGGFDVPGTYKLTGNPPGGGFYTYKLLVYIYEGTTFKRAYEDIGKGVLVTINSGERIAEMRIAIYSGQDFTTPKVFKPMLSDAALNLSYSDYQPYAMTNRELTEGFCIDISSYFSVTGVSDPTKVCALIYAVYLPAVKVVMALFNAGTNSTGTFSWISLGTVSKYKPTEYDAMGCFCGPALRGGGGDDFRIYTNGNIEIRNLVGNRPSYNSMFFITYKVS